MNNRALVLGVAIGFVVAVAPSCNCGGPCNGANCGGCCDAKGACVKRPGNGNDATCGNQGNACVDCTVLLQTCNKSTFVCSGAGGGNGGSGGAGGAVTDGCLLPSGTPVPLSQVTTTNCGKNGVLCSPCQTGQSCPRTGTNAGTCVAAVTKVGDPCGSDTDCSMLGAAAICKQATNPGGASYLNGYCTFLCTGSGDPICPTGSSCVGLSAQYGESDAICMDECASGTDPCRSPGYNCYNITGAAPVKACWISPLPALDGGPPSLRTGDTCDAGADCTPDGTGTCFAEVSALSDGGSQQSGYLGGYCSRLNCISSNDCATDGGGLCLSDSSGTRACMRRCSGPAVGQSDCRAGYVCEGYTRGLSDGGTAPSTDGYCSPNCNNIVDYCGNYPDAGPVACSVQGYCAP